MAILVDPREDVTRVAAAFRMIALALRDLIPLEPSRNASIYRTYLIGARQMAFQVLSLFLLALPLLRLPGRLRMRRSFGNFGKCA